MSELRLPTLLRLPTEADIPLVTDSWLRSYAKDRPAGTDRLVYEHHERALIRRLWLDPGVTWLLAAPPDAGTFAYGFLCGEATDAGPVVHYIYVKRPNRRYGVAGELLEAFMEGQPRDRAFYTHRTRSWEDVLATSHRFRPQHFIYDPYLAWEAPWRDA